MSAGFDWLNGVAAESSSSARASGLTPSPAPPPVSFGLTPNSSSASLPLPTVSHLGSLNNSTANSTVDLSRTVNNGSSTALAGGSDTPEDLSVPLTLRADELSAEEAKTYLRWYNDIVVRRGTNLIRLEDVFAFMRNFSIPEPVRAALSRIFTSVTSLNVGEFFALLRLISHSILGQKPKRALIKDPAPIPKPRSILSAKRVQDADDQEDDVPANGKPKDKFDLDSFTEMLMTGETPRKKKKNRKGHRRIQFSDQVSVEPTRTSQVEPVKIDLSLPMDQLMKSMPKKEAPTVVVSEDDDLPDVPVDTFQHIKNVDSALIHGTPSNIPSVFFDEVYRSPSPNVEQPDPMIPNITGPVRLLSPSHTGPGIPLHASSTGPNMNSHSMIDGLLSPNYEALRSQAALSPSMTGSLTSSMRSHQQQVQQQQQTHVPQRLLSPPVPPARRARSLSQPEAVGHVTLEQLAQATLPHETSQHSLKPPMPPPERMASPNRVSSPLAPAPPPPRRRGMSLTQQQQQPAPPSRSTPSPSLQQQQEQQQLNGFAQHFLPDPPQQYSNGVQQAPALPPKIPMVQNTSNNPYGGHLTANSGSAVNILDDLKALQNEVDRLHLYQS